MLKRIFNLSSPVGIALTVAGVVLALSPEARRATRQALVKGTSLLLGAVDTVKSASAGLVSGAAESTEKIGGITNNFIEDTMRGSTVDSGVSENRPEFH